jgi:transglutaminase-like putative cysteine protease
MAGFWHRLRSTRQKTSGYKLEEPAMSVRTFPVLGKYRFGWLIMLILAVVFVIGLVTGLTDSIWKLSPTWLIPLGLSATTAGWWAGGTKRFGSTYFVIGIISGVLILILFQSEAYRDFFRAFLEAQQTQIFDKPLNLNRPNIGPAFYHLYSAVNNLLVYFYQLSQWFRNLILNKPSPNLPAINLIWGSLLWSVLFSMGWLLRRQTHAFLAALPALTLLCGVIGYTRRQSTGLIIILSAVFAMIVLTQLLMREDRWETQQIDYSEEMRFDILTHSIPVLVLILALAGILPSISLANIRSLLNLQTWTTSKRQINISTSLGLDQEPLDPIAGSPQVGMSRSHLIGSGVELSELKIMEISPGEFYLPPQIDPGAQLPTYYWFGHAYDIYTGSGWMTDNIHQVIFQADQQIQGNESPAQRIIKHTFRKTDAASPTLYFTGLLQSVNQTVSVFRHATTQDYLFGQINAKQYQVNTAIYDFAEEQLRQSTADPPETIQETYLQLPDEIPERVVELALDLTDQAMTPYENAKAIETYLRQFEYTLDLPSPPQNREIVDYFLFDLQKGYCDYYASAMVVLARLSGLPARFVVGYGPGTYDYTQQQLIVTEANAHAWPEIYLEPFGWVPFEPTASFAPRVWENDTEGEIVSSPVSPEDIRTAAPDSNRYPAWRIPVLLTIIAAVWWFILRRKRNETTTITQIESIYQSTRAHLTQVFFKLNTEHTPQEFNRTYSDFLQGIKRAGFTPKMAQQVITHLTYITNLYEKGVYSPHEIFIHQVAEARKNLNTLRIRSLLLKVACSIKKS